MDIKLLSFFGLYLQRLHILYNLFDINLSFIKLLFWRRFVIFYLLGIIFMCWSKILTHSFLKRHFSVCGPCTLNVCIQNQHKPVCDPFYLFNSTPWHLLATALKYINFLLPSSSAERGGEGSTYQYTPLKETFWYLPKI